MHRGCRPMTAFSRGSFAALLSSGSGGAGPADTNRRRPLQRSSVGMTVSMRPMATEANKAPMMETSIEGTMN